MTAILFLTRNEENTIGNLIDELNFVLKKIPELKAKCFLCDDSTDQTANIAKKKGLEVIKGRGKGLGWSYYFAIYILFQSGFENIITIDGDGQADLSELPLFYKELNKGYDLVVGSRFLQKKLIFYDYKRLNFIGVKILSFFITISTLQRFTDSHGGLRAMKSSVAKKMKFLGTHSYVQETIITAKEQGFKIKEIPSIWKKRTFGESRVLCSKWTYIKKMSWPLFLRMKAHYLFFITALFFLFNDILFIGFMILFFFGELYKNLFFTKNLREVKKWAKNG